MIGLMMAALAAAACTGNTCTTTPCALRDAPCLAGRQLPATGPFFSGDLNAVLADAEEKKLPVVISLGREMCTRCLKLYGYFERGELRLDPKKCVYLKLHVDNAEHREQFLSMFGPRDNRLPYLGIHLKDDDLGKACLSGETKRDNYRFFLKDFLLPTAP